MTKSLWMRNAGADLLALSTALLASGAHAAVTISSQPTSNMSCSGGVCAPTAASAVLNAGDLETMLASGNVTVTTTGSGAQATDIDVTARFGWTATSTLTLDAYRSLNFGKPVSVAGMGGLSLVTNDGGSGGTLFFADKARVAFANLSSPLTIDGGAYTLVNSVAGLASAVNANQYGDFALCDNYDAGKDGIYKSVPITAIFLGKAEGLGNTIFHLTIAVSTKRENPFVGLFGVTDAGSLIENLRIAKVDISATGIYPAAGSLVGESAGALFNDSVSGNIKVKNVGPWYRNNDTLAGGLVASDIGAIVSSHSTATVSGTAGSVLGGLVGISQSDTITNSYATGVVSLAGGGVAGGLVGEEDNGNLSGSFATGMVSGTTKRGRGELGGLIGWDPERGQGISNCYATGEVAASGGTWSLGGFVGASSDLTSTSYSTGKIDASSGGAGFSGGLSSDYEVTNDYWDTTTSGTQIGVVGGNVVGVTGLTTRQLRSGLPAGFDSTVWAENKKINNGFPYLIANPPPK